MFAQCIDSVEVTRQFDLGQCRVDLFVAYLMQQNGGPALASLKLWDQMVQASTTFGDRTVAERADRIGICHDLTSR